VLRDLGTLYSHNLTTTIYDSSCRPECIPSLGSESHVNTELKLSEKLLCAFAALTSPPALLQLTSTNSRGMSQQVHQITLKHVIIQDLFRNHFELKL
jgi:hypothetical protein